MYHPKIVQKRLSNLAGVIRQNIDPAFDFKDYSIDQVAERVEKLDTYWDYDNMILRAPLSVEDEAFIRNEVNRCKVDFRYWSTHYAKLKDKQMSLVRFAPTAVQELLLKKIEEAELDAVSGKTGDGILFMVLKARQLGVSTISEIIIAHRTFFFGNTTSLIAADVDERTQNLYEMLVRVYDNLPWWMQPRSSDPKRDYRVKNKQIYFFDQDSVIRMGSSANMQGGDSGSDKGSMGTGMSQPLNAQLLTPSGWISMGAIKLGDYVVGSNGTPVVVDGIYPQGIKSTYRVTCTDSSSVECSNDHVWEVWLSGQRQLVTTLQMKQLLDVGKSVMIKTVKPVQFTEQNPLTIPPYMLGVLIGDGSISQKMIGFSSADAEIIQTVGAQLPPNHYLRQRTKYDYVIASTGKENTVRRALKTLKLHGTRSYEKFIPESYLFASIDDRVELLRGLLDTDGSIATRDKNIEFCTTSKQLVNDVIHLVQSLGGTVSVKVRAPFVSYFSYKGKLSPSQTRESYRLRIRLPLDMNPFKLTRKAILYAPIWEPKRKVESIVYVGEKESQCIHIQADDHLYVTEGFLLTHNTLPLVHLSELALWNNPWQIDDALMPSIPMSPRTFAIFESTAKGRGNWWHDKWVDAKRGLGRRRPIFIPWYTSPDTYRLPAPTDWVPSDAALNHAERVHNTSSRWLGYTVQLTKDQLFWWERTRAEYISGRVLHKFLAEYTADDMEAFQNTTIGVFPSELIDDMRQKAVKTPTLVEIKPRMELAT